MDDQPEQVPQSADAAPYQLTVHEIAPTDREELERKRRAGSNWFFWIALLSVANSMIRLAHGDIQFVVGLGATEITNFFALEIAKQHPEAAVIAKCVGFGMALLAAAFFAAFGLGGRHGLTLVFVLGMGFYLLDLIVVAFLHQWINVAWHMFVLIRISSGLRAAWMLNWQLRSADGNA